MLQKFHFSIEVALNSLQTQKGLELVFRPQFSFTLEKQTSKNASNTTFNKRAEATTSGYSATGEFLQYIYSVLVAKNHQKIELRFINFPQQIFFNEINHGYRATFYMAVATYCYYEKVRKMMRTAIASYLLSKGGLIR